MARRTAVLLLALTVASPAFAHVGSPHLYREGEVGPWPLLVVVHMPPAVPGEARVGVTVKGLSPDEQVTVRVRGIPPEGEEHAPPFVEATRDAVDPSYWSAPIPLYVFGSWEAEVEVLGARGEGSIRVPFHADVPRPTELPTSLATVLVLLMMLCGVSAWQMWRGLGQEGVLEPGTEPKRKDRIRGLCFGSFGLGLVLFFVAFTLYTWYVYDRVHWSRIAVAGFDAEAFVTAPPPRAGRPNTLRLVMTDSSRQPLPELLEIDGEPLHLTAIELSSGRELHHLHPQRAGHPAAFETTFRPETAGSYRLYAEIRAADGRLVTVMKDLPVAAGTRLPGPGRGVSATAPAFGEARGGRAELAGGSSLHLVSEGGTEVAVDEFRRWSFELRDPTGAPLGPLEPVERGELGHLIVQRHDGEVFVRLAPSGSIGASTAVPRAEAPGRVSFPYAFPEVGEYRLWVHLRHAGREQLAAFDVSVSEPN